MPQYVLKSEYDAAIKRLDVLEKELRNVKGAPVIQGNIGKRFDLNDNLDVLKLHDSLTTIESDITTLRSNSDTNTTTIQTVESSISGSIDGTEGHHARFISGGHSIGDSVMTEFSDKIGISVAGVPSEKLEVTGNIKATLGSLVSTVIGCVSPVQVSSTFLCTNLNADLLDGQHGSYYTTHGVTVGTIPKAASATTWANSPISVDGTKTVISGDIDLSKATPDVIINTTASGPANGIDFKINGSSAIFISNSRNVSLSRLAAGGMVKAVATDGLLEIATANIDYVTPGFLPHALDSTTIHSIGSLTTGYIPNILTDKLVNSPLYTDGTSVWLNYAIVAGTNPELRVLSSVNTGPTTIGMANGSKLLQAVVYGAGTPSTVCGLNYASLARITTDASSALLVDHQDSAPIAFGINNAEIARITSTGVGLGTVSPEVKLDIHDNSSVITYPLFLSNNYGISTDVDGVGIKFGRGGIAQPWGAVVGRQWAAGTYSGGCLLFQTETSDALGLETKMVINPTGNVGIGTMYPGEKLDTVGNIQLQRLDNDAVGNYLKVLKSRNGADGQDNDVIGGIQFDSYDNGTPTRVVYGSVIGRIGSASSGSPKGEVGILLQANTGQYETLTLKRSTGSSAAGAVIDVIATGTNLQCTNDMQLTPSGDDVFIDGGLHVGGVLGGTAPGDNNLIVDGTVQAANIGADTDNSVIVLNSSGYLKTDEIDSRVWGSTLIDGSGAAGYLASFSDADTLAKNTVACTASVELADDASVQLSTILPILSSSSVSAGLLIVAADWTSGDGCVGGYSLSSSVYRIFGSANYHTADDDTFVCVYIDTYQYILKNRTGYTKTFFLTYTGKGNNS